jgi:hypothetical protein
LVAVFQIQTSGVANPGSGAFFDPWIGIGIRDEKPGSYFRELRNNSLIWIRDAGWKNGINIPNPQHCKLDPDQYPESGSGSRKTKKHFMVWRA